MDWNDLIDPAPIPAPPFVEYDTNHDEMFVEWKVPLALHNVDEAEMLGCGRRDYPIPSSGLPCPSSGECINDGFCNREYEAWSKRPHVWRGDYA